MSEINTPNKPEITAAAITINQSIFPSFPAFPV